ncbi:MAG: hypothetical protein AB8B51_07910, partial [Sedimentitalea sp.]
TRFDNTLRLWNDYAVNSLVASRIAMPPDQKSQMSALSPIQPMMRYAKTSKLGGNRSFAAVASLPFEFAEADNGRPDPPLGLGPVLSGSGRLGFSLNDRVRKFMEHKKTRSLALSWPAAPIVVSSRC